MAHTLTEFENEVSTDLADLGVNANKIFTPAALAVYRKKAIRYLYRKRLAQETANYSTAYTDMPLAVSTTLDYALPATWVDVVDVSYWTNETNTLFIAQSGMYDWRERSGYVRIYDGPDWAGYRIHMLGLLRWVDITDASMPDEVYDVAVLATEYYAGRTLANKRAGLRKSTSAQDTSLGAEVLWLRDLQLQLKEAVKDARKVMRPRGI